MSDSDGFFLEIYSADIETIIEAADEVLTLDLRVEEIPVNNYIEIIDAPKGADGATILHGFAPPLPTVGRENDFYMFIDTNARVLYGPKVGSSWGTGFTVGSGSGGGSVYLAAVETPDGVRTLFSLAQAYTPGSLAVYLNGMLLTPTLDFTEASSTTFSMGEPPLSGDILRAHVTPA